MNIGIFGNPLTGGLHETSTLKHIKHSDIKMFVMCLMVQVLVFVCHVDTAGGHSCDDV